MKVNIIDLGKRYLVTGGSGFLGQCLINRILKAGGNVKTIARDEGKLIELKQKHPQVEIITGDIGDIFDLKQSLKSADVDASFFEKSTQLLSKEIKQWKITVAKLQQVNEAYAKLLDIDEIVCNNDSSLEEKLEELLNYEKTNKPQPH